MSYLWTNPARHMRDLPLEPWWPVDATPAPPVIVTEEGIHCPIIAARPRPYNLPRRLTSIVLDTLQVLAMGVGGCALMVALWWVLELGQRALAR